MLNVIAQCHVFLKIKLIYIEFTFAVVYTAEVNSVKMVISLYLD